MPRPFRFQPPSLPEHAVSRQRLLETLGRRWDHRVVTVVAGPGFGKTALLAAATAMATATVNWARTGHRDVWLSCEPADESAEHLTAGLATALDLSPEADLAAILDAVWAAAPVDVCLVLDDVHEIPAATEGAALLARLVTDLAANGHLVLASRDTIPVPLARLAATGQLVRLGERDLLFDEAEVEAFAAARDVDPVLLGSNGGWPALAELTASAGADLVLDYLWEEVLARLGDEQARLLARFVAVGGGDDEVASALAGRAVSVDTVVASVPLVQRSIAGWAALHPLWEPALRGLLSNEEAADARRAAGEIHLRNRRYSLAVDLFVEAGAWDHVLSTIVDAERQSAITAADPDGPGPRTQHITVADFGRWHRVLPPPWRQEPEALLAAGLELRGRRPPEALSLFVSAAEGFRAKGDIDGELAAISHDGLVRWWLNDGPGLFALYGRLGVLAAEGSERARSLAAVGVAAMGHLSGDSAAVLAALGPEPTEWPSTAHWFRSVAYRRNGDLRRSLDELDAIVDPLALADPQIEIARLRSQWLAGRVDDVVARLPEFHARYVQSGNQFLSREVGLELAAKAAFLGDVAQARRLVDEAAALLIDAPSVLATTLASMARAAIAVAEGDDPAAGEVLHGEVIGGVAALGRPESWYWRDRAAIALVYVLVPETRPAWSAEQLGPAHVPGLALAEALVATRRGDLAELGALRWPSAGVVRAHLPSRWVAELAAAGTAAGHPPPDDLLRAVGPGAAPALQAVADAHPVKGVAAAARRLARELPATPPYLVRIDVVGPLRVVRDGVEVSSPDLRRQRVRELLGYLVARHRVRREEVGEALWPAATDPAHNLRVTLDYLQRVLEPDRPHGQRPYFVRASRDWLELTVDDHLEVDAWELEAWLEDARAAERAGAVPIALDAYRLAMPLWRGDPFADAAYAEWAEPHRARLRSAYVAAALRAGELWLAARAPDARQAAEHAIAADPATEAAYHLLARAHLADGDRSGARGALRRGVAALADLGVEPETTTATLMKSLGG